MPKPALSELLAQENELFDVYGDYASAYADEALRMEQRIEELEHDNAEAEKHICELRGRMQRKQNKIDELAAVFFKMRLAGTAREIENCYNEVKSIILMIDLKK